MAIDSQKLLPPAKSGSLAKYSNAKVSSIVITKKFGKDIVKSQTKIVKIQNILKGTLAIEKKSLDNKKREESGKRLSSQEEKLETKPNVEKGGLKMPKRPRLGIFDWIKNFIKNVILGYFAVRLVEHLPKIIPVVKFLGNATDFILNVGGKFLNGLATFVDWGYKAYDATRGFIKNIGGENFAQVFDKFVGAVDTTLFLASFIAADLAIEAMSGGDGGGLGDIVGDQIKKRLFQKGAQKVAGQAAGQVARTAGMGAGAVAGIVAGAGLLASALGEGAFQVRKVVVKPIQNLEKAYKEDKNPLTKIGRGIALNMVRPLYGVFSTVGFLLDVVGAPFRYAIELLRFPFLSEEDKQKQANNLAKFDARIREDLRKALNMVTLGLAFKEKGSFGNIYGNKGAQKDMMSKMAGGGITRGGKAQTGARRTIGAGGRKGKYKRVVPRKPGKIDIKPGADVGGKDKIFGIFPNPLEGAKKVMDSINPFAVVKTTGEDLNKSDYFGPILAITSKITLGQKPSQKDYENVGLGINMLIAKGIRDKQLKGGLVAAFAEGGFVDPDVLSAAETGGDVSNWVTKTFKGEVESNAQKTLRMIRENAKKKKSQEEQKPPSPDDMGDGMGVQVSSDSEDFWLLATAAMFENSDPQGAADVAQVIYNRTQYPAWNAPTIRKAILNPGQFQPVRQYGGTNAWASIKTKEDALRFSKSHGKTQEQLERVAAALLNKDKQSNARSFVGPRDSFRAEAYEKANNHLANETEKTRHGHTFGFEPGGAMIGQFKAGKLAAAQVNENVTGNVNLSGGNGKFIQGNSGASGGVHFHIGPGTQPGQVDTKYNADARKAAQQVVKHFLGKKSLHDGRRGASYTSGSDGEIMAAQKAHSATGSQGGIDIQVGGADPGAATRIPFPFAVTNMAERPGGFGVSAKIAGLNAFVAHGRYNESGKLATQLGTRSSPPFTTAEGYAFHGKSFGIVPKGGMKLNLHEGEMYKVIDKDSVNLLGYDLSKEIIDIENKAQLVAKAPSIISRLSAISGYAPYDALAPQTVLVSPEQYSSDDGYSSSDSSDAMVFASSGGDEESFDPLYRGC